MRWTAKNARGSICEGEKRGEAVVQAVLHSSRQVAAQSFYSGEKESEQPALRVLLEQSGLSTQKVSFDALHCQAETLETIAQGGGKYLVGLKANQTEIN